MKPTPSRLVLLMSAAGVSLSFSGVALAALDSNAPANVALTFGTTPKEEQDCNLDSQEAWASCAPLSGDLLNVIVAESDALPLPLTLLSAPSDERESREASHGYSAEAAGPPSLPRNTGASGREPVPTAALLVDDAEVDGPVERADSGVYSAGGVEDQPRVRREGKTGEAAVVDRPQLAAVSTSREARRSDNSTQVETRVELTETESVALERVFASLAEVLGVQLEDSATEFDQSSEQAVESNGLGTPPTLADDQPTALPRVETAAAPSPEAGSSLERSGEVDDIVVVSSHSERVLMSLAAMRSTESSQPVRLGAQTKKTVVTRHSDKVLETLALFRQTKSERAALACSPEIDNEPQAVRSAASVADVDIFLDLMPPAANPADEQVLQADVALPAPPAPPLEDAGGRSAMGADMIALSADKLDQVRGGFVTDGGLKISFGIERAVYLNGNLVTTTSLNISDLSRISGGQAQVTGNSKDALALMQSGTGNVFSPGSISSTAAGTVIQNTLNDQKINTITRIDAVVNSSGIMRSINLQSSMQSAIVNSLRR